MYAVTTHFVDRHWTKTAQEKLHKNVMTTSTLVCDILLLHILGQFFSTKIFLDFDLFIAFSKAYRKICRFYGMQKTKHCILFEDHII